MKIAAIGYSGSGKSTLTKRLAEKLEIPYLHLDAVNCLPNWAARDREEARRTHYRDNCRIYRDKTTVCKSDREVARFLASAAK